MNFTTENYFIILSHKMKIALVYFTVATTVSHAYQSSNSVMLYNDVSGNQFMESFGNLSNSLAIKSRRKRFLRSFPDDSTLELNFKLVVPYYDVSPLTIQGDYRLDFTFQLPDEIHHKRPQLSRDQEYVYDTMTHFIDRMGYDGDSCLLKAICEVAAHPLDEYGLYGDVFNLVLSPHQTSNYHWTEHSEAEEYGLRYGNCDQEFPECQVSVRSLLVSAIMGEQQSFPH